VPKILIESLSVHHMKATLIAITPHAEDVVAQMGHVAHRSESKNVVQFIEALIRMGHESVLEHASATILVEEVSRALSHQLVRHRLVSYTQESQRYVKQGQFDYVIPPTISQDPRTLAAFRAAMAEAERVYLLLQQFDVPAEDARFVLPNACHTRIAITANFREWRHMITLRCDKHAQWEIRELFTHILHLLHSNAPRCFEDLFAKFVS
jgi:thymidylate synthase (FAD)